jgi:hypothetical protein
MPTLRSLGQAHEAFGIQEAHYDVVFTQLMDAIGAELPSDVWDFETRAGEIHDLFCLYRDFVLRCGYFFRCALLLSGFKINMQNQLGRWFTVF